MGLPTTRSCGELKETQARLLKLLLSAQERLLKERAAEQNKPAMLTGQDQAACDSSVPASDYRVDDKSGKDAAI